MQLAFYVQPLRGAYDPNSGNHMDMWVVYRWYKDASLPSIPWQVAYCSTEHDALTIAALLTATLAPPVPESPASERETPR